MMPILTAILTSIIAAGIYDAVREGKAKRLYRLAKDKPFEAVLLISLWIIIAGIWTLTVAFLQG